MTNSLFATTTADKIKIADDRTREDFGDISGLAQSILEHGQIQPLAVERIEDDPDYDYLLLAGERRLEAMSTINYSPILVRIYPTGLLPIQRDQIELAENYHRKDFTWREKVNLQRKIYETEVAIYGKKISTSPDAPGHSMSKQAGMLGVTHAKVSQDLKLAQAMEDFPEVDWEKCKNQHEATKLMNRMEEQLIRRELTKRHKTNTSKSSIVKKLDTAYIIQDCLKGIELIDDEMFDFIEIDPPYAINLHHQKKSGGPSEQAPSKGLENYNEISDEYYEPFMRKLFTESFRVAKKNSWLICWFGPDPWFEQIFTWLTDAGWKTTRLAAVWTKRQAQANNPSRLLANATEYFFYAWKGDPVLARPGTLNVFTHSPVPPNQKVHPTERPIELMSDLVTLFAFPGATVLVPFAGSGNTLIAAGLNNMSPIGFDLEPNYKDAYVLKALNIFGGEDEK